MPALSQRLWAAIEPIYAEILAHPFLGGLTEGSLDPDAFRFYLAQDGLYLRAYARALSLCAARAPEPDDVAMFDAHAAGAIAVERALHEGLLAEMGVDPSHLDRVTPSPTTTAYTSYLMAAAATGSFAEALGAVLPCYWIYAQVGAELQEQGSPDPRYQRWIDTYGSEQFAAVVAAVLALTDRLDQRLSDSDRAAMQQRFVTTSRYEWMFWDAAYRQEVWPV